MRAQARDAETIYAAQMLILRRREDALSDYVATIERLRRAQPGAGRVARDPADGAPDGRRHARRAWRSSAELAQDEFAAIPRDMFWFTAIALLGETCALIARRRARAACSTALLEPHREQLVQITPGREPRLDRTASSRCCAAAQGDLDRGRARTSRPGWSATRACGLRPVVALMRREFAELLLARGDAERGARAARGDAARGRGGRDVAARQPRANETRGASDICMR